MSTYKIKCNCGGTVEAEYNPERYDYLVRCPKCREWIEIHWANSKISNSNYVKEIVLP